MEKTLAEMVFEGTLDTLLTGTVYDETNDTEDEKALRLEEDGTLRTWGLSVGLANGQETPILLEDNGSPRVMLYGYDGAAEQRLRTEASRELAISLYGQDESANLDALRTDPDRILRTRPYDGYVHADAIIVPAAAGTLWLPATTAGHLYEVCFLLVNVDAGAALVTGTYIGVDLGAAGALVRPNYWFYDETIPFPGTSGWRGPFLMAGNDAIRGVTLAADEVAMQFRIRRVDVEI